MNVADAVRQMLWEVRVTQQELGKRLNGRQSLISMRLSRGNRITVAKVLEMIEACDYEMVIQPRKTAFRPKDQILITQDNGI